MRPLFVGLLASLLSGYAVPTDDRTPLHYSLTLVVCESDREVVIGPSQETREDPGTGDLYTVIRVPVACADT